MLKRLFVGVGIAALLLALPVVRQRGQGLLRYHRRFQEDRGRRQVLRRRVRLRRVSVDRQGRPGRRRLPREGTGLRARQGIGFTSTSDISIGAQAGGQAYSQIVFFENAEALNRFTGGNFEFAASASAIAVQATAEASASTEGTGASASGSKTTEKATAGAEYQGGWWSSPWPRAA